MSYSFNVRAATKAEAIAKVAEELAAVVVAQPAHAADQHQAQLAADVFIQLLRDDDTLDVVVAVNGSLWMPDAGIQQATFGVTAGLTTKAP
jgi:hypothetical protein